MLFTIFVLFYLGSIIRSSEGSSKSRCAVVIFVNQSSFHNQADFSEYVDNIRGLSSNHTNVYFSKDPDLFKVRHEIFIDAPGLFALESRKYPGKYLRRANHTIVLEEKQSTEDFKNDATFLMDHAEKNETYTTFKLFSHRSWKLSTPPDSHAPLFFDDYKDNIAHSRTSELLVVAQPCPQNESERKQVVKSSKPKPNVKPNEPESVVKSSKPKPNVKPNEPQSGSGSDHISQHVTEKLPLPTDAILSGNTNTKYLTGLEAPKPDAKPATVVENKTPQQLIPGHANKSPTTKQKISDLSSLINDPDIYDMVKSSKPKPNVKPNEPESGSGSDHVSRHVTERPPLPTDAILSGNSNTKYFTAITNQGNLKTIPNEYSFNDYEVPDFVMNSLIENAKTAGDGLEAPKPDAKPATVVEDKTPQQLIPGHANKSPTTKQKISDLSSLIDDPDIYDIENNLKDLQYGSKGCKLLVAEDTMEEDATSKDSIAHPKIKKECVDEFPEACVEMANKGYCLAFKSLMSSVCRRSCNLCSRLLDTGFTSCTKTCGGGRQMRMIKINRREYLQTRRCSSHPCPINGSYSAFGRYTECSVTCGEGVKYRRRTCTEPRPQYNGRSCRRLGPSIESRRCHAGPCPQKHGHEKKQNKEKTRKVKYSHHHKAALHIGGPHSDQVHQHSILLKGKKVANLRCTPKNGAIRNIIQDSPTKRFTVHPLKNNHHSSKKSSIEESGIIYNRDGLPVDTARTVVKAFKSPYKIILARKGHNDMKLLEECLEVDDKIREEDSLEEKHHEEEDTMYDKSYSEGKHHEGNLVYTRPGDKSYSDFDEYKYETGNIVTPEVSTSHDDEEHDYSSPPSGKLFGEPKNLDDILSKMNSISPKVNDQISHEQNLENSLKMENAKPVDAMAFTGAEDGNEREDDMDSAERAGFSVTTTQDSLPQSRDDTNTDKDNYGYSVETLPDR